MLFQRLMIAN